ncbi:MAG: thioredoxin [Clostridia bacterium]|nr:thioredoxin [Clostridia bacterium]
MSKFVREINGEELKNLIASGKTVVCDFWASWCGPCRMLAPVMDEVASELSSRAEFVKVDIDQNEEVAMALGVMSIPDVYVFQEGKVKAHNLGFVPKAVLKAFIENNI